MTELTFATRYDNASKELRKAGIKIYRNVMGCCRSCIGSDKFDNPTEPILWHYGGQGGRISLQGDYVVYDEGNFVSSIYLNHSNLTDELKDKVVEVFTKHGIVLDWDKSDFMCIVVKPKLSVPHRTDEEQAWLINTWLDKYNLTYREMFEYSYEFNNFIDRFWSKSNYGGYTEDWFEAQFSRKRTEIDDKIRRDREYEERQAYRERQNAKMEQLLEVLPEFPERERFLKWLNQEVPNVFTLSESDIENAGASLREIEQRQFIGEFEDRDDFAKKHYAEDTQRLPNWVIEQLSWNNVAYGLGRTTHWIVSGKWSEPTLVWKRLQVVA